jgi:hypothetical protein
MYQISVPSKTFLIGEYVALEGGPALVVNTEPRFQLQIFHAGTSHPNSLGSGLNLKHVKHPALEHVLSSSFFSDYEMFFSDPFEGRGGLGASSAMIAMAMAFRSWKESGDVDALSLLNELKKNSHFIGSGYDFCAQLTGGITHIEKNKSICQAAPWPWPSHEVLLLRGPRKTITHEHLLDAKKDFSLLHKISEKAIVAYARSDFDGFINALDEFANEQIRLGLVIDETVNHVKVLKENSLVRHARGCGAMGSDILLVIVSRDRSESWDQEIKSRFEVLPSLISRGFRVSKTRLQPQQSHQTFEVRL